MKCFKLIAIFLYIGFFFLGALYCCVKCTHIEYQDETIFTENNAEKQMANLVVDVNFISLGILNLDFFLVIFCWIHFKLEGIFDKCITSSI